MKYWLMKSEPNCFSVDDLASAPHQTTCWDGVRNYQACGFMREGMVVGDLAFFYHSNVALPGIAGVMKVVRAGYPDHTSSDSKFQWFMVDVALVKKLDQLISLSELRSQPDLQGMKLLQKGNRLSVLPVEPWAWHWICSHWALGPFF